MISTPSTQIPQLGKNAFNTRDLIIQTLSNKWPLNAKQIFNEVTKEAKNPISYQAVHKVLNQLIEENVLEKNENGYQLNINWVKQVKDFSTKLEKAYIEGERESLEDLTKKEYFTKSFDSWLEFSRFMVYQFFQFPYEKNQCAAIVRINYPAIGFSKEDLDKLKEFIFKSNVYAVCKGSTKLDIFLGKAWGAMGANFKLGVGPDRMNDTFVVGDYVCDVYLSERLRTAWSELFNRLTEVEEFNLEEMYKLMFSKDFKVDVVVYKNSEIAEKIRQEVLKYFR